MTKPIITKAYDKDEIIIDVMIIEQNPEGMKLL